jgi:dolichol kinase
MDGSHAYPVCGHSFSSSCSALVGEEQNKKKNKIKKEKPVTRSISIA